MIIAKGEFFTDEILSCEKNTVTNKWDIKFKNGASYSYGINNVIFMKNPISLNPNDYMIENSEGKQFFDIKKLCEFRNGKEKYLHIVFDGFCLNYNEKELRIRENCLADEKSGNKFEYLKALSKLSNLKNDKGEIILEKHYEKISFVPNSSALSRYLNYNTKIKKRKCGGIIFPFGCNSSQYQAVRNALENQISIIQGPPGTGKTQTILNIIANIIKNGESVLVVSNNNSATKNVLEKLAKEKYGMDFLVAPLGSSENKTEFIDLQCGKYPELSNWVQTEAPEPETISELTGKLQKVYLIQEEIAKLRNSCLELKLEAEHFEAFAKETAAFFDTIKIRGRLSSKKVMKLWQEIQNRVDKDRALSIWMKFKSIFYYGIANWRFYEQDLSKIITVLQGLYYKHAIEEMENALSAKEKELAECDAGLEKDLEEKSLTYLKHKIAGRYKWEDERKIFTQEDLFRNPEDFIKEYPISLSTTFSARSSVNLDKMAFDYVIMDEASQVDIATGALSLSCAKNAVIVGDLKQLPNVVDSETMEKADSIRKRFDLPQAYDFAHKSFLQSVVELIQEAPSTLLKEHYRCNSRIIEFCNKKFYDGELLVMNKDACHSDTLKAYITVPGNHERNHYSQRQIDIIKQEVLPSLNAPKEEIGIIAPYNNQVDAIKSQIPDIETATVHKFQGREKEVIILSTVDDQIKDFTDDPYLLNVAVSRAKKQLIVIVSGNEQSKAGNIADLIDYIKYNKMEVVDSKVYSVFDFLYSQYREKRWEYLKGHGKVSQYDSENLTFSLLQELLASHRECGVACFEPLSMVIRDMEKLSEKELKYVMNPSTHLDFLVFNKLSKKPLLAIETDGYDYHKPGTEQYERDRMKDHILELCELPMLRLKTNGSNEKEKILQALGL